MEEQYNIKDVESFFDSCVGLINEEQKELSRLILSHQETEKLLNGLLYEIKGCNLMVDVLNLMESKIEEYRSKIDSLNVRAKESEDEKCILQKYLRKFQLDLSFESNKECDTKNVGTQQTEKV